LSLDFWKPARQGRAAFCCGSRTEQTSSHRDCGRRTRIVCFVACLTVSSVSRRGLRTACKPPIGPDLIPCHKTRARSR
jgi:hypothetical protein